MAAWRVARSLDVLLAQLNKLAPSRSKKSDGSIGDAAHASRESDHNPYIKLDGVGIVRARDFTHDPFGGLDCNWLAAVLVASDDPRIRYVIWNRRIWTPGRGWVAYKGSNPHDKHLHLSVSEQPGWFDSTMPWALNDARIGSPGKSLPAAPAKPAAPIPSLVQEDDVPTVIVNPGQSLAVPAANPSSVDLHVTVDNPRRATIGDTVIAGVDLRMAVQRADRSWWPVNLPGFPKGADQFITAVGLGDTSHHLNAVHGRVLCVSVDNRGFLPVVVTLAPHPA